MVDIIFEDNHLLVINKPANLATQVSKSHLTSLEEEAKKWLRTKTLKTGNIFLQPIHRLDTVVSGLVVFAKTSKALSRLQLAMRTRSVKKVYLGLVSKEFPFKEGVFEDYLIHGDHRALRSQKSDPLAKHAKLHYTLKANLQNFKLVEIYLDTGRYHQIRAQFSFNHFPIIGDQKYRSLIKWELPGIALHHSYFAITHPVLKTEIEFRSSPKWEALYQV